MSHHHHHEEDVKVKRLKAKARAHLQGVPMPAAHVPWLESYIKPKHAPCSFRITASMDQAGVFFVHYKRKNAPDQVMAFLEGHPLVPNAIYNFEIPLQKHDRVNVECDTGPVGLINILRIEEIDSTVGQSTRQ